MNRQGSPAVFLVALVACLLTFAAVAANPRSALAEQDAHQLLSEGTKALRDGRASDAIGAFETLADRGIVDAAASYDRGLAYAMRVRIGAEVPGDLGRAAHGFEEARDLAHDPRLAGDAAKALTIVRSEVARRRIRAGESVEVDPGHSLARTLAAFLHEDIWSILSAASCALLAVATFVRFRMVAKRIRVTASVVAGLSATIFVCATAMTLVARHVRLSVKEAVVVAANARPSDERGIAALGSAPLPEGARVEVVESRGESSRIRFGNLDAWVPATCLRELVRAGG